MASKTKDENGEPKANDTSIGTDVPNDAPEPIAAVEPSVEPTEFDWRGHTAYQCPSCGYNSLNRDRTVDHIRMTHSGSAHLATGYRERRKGTK